MDIHGEYEGGGVCEECQDHTTGINCQTCEVKASRMAHWIVNHTGTQSFTTTLSFS